jgi:hypothetical protein
METLDTYTILEMWKLQSFSMKPGFPLQVQDKTKYNSWKSCYIKNYSIKQKNNQATVKCKVTKPRTFYPRKKKVTVPKLVLTHPAHRDFRHLLSVSIPAADAHNNSNVKSFLNTASGAKHDTALTAHEQGYVSKQAFGIHGNSRKNILAPVLPREFFMVFMA